MKKLENSVEAHKVCLEMFEMLFITYSANVNAMCEFFPCTPRLSFIDVDVGCGL
jgi:hypothetical protein